MASSAESDHQSPLKANIQVAVTNKRAIRGRTAALLANLNDTSSSSDADDESSGSSKMRVLSKATLTAANPNKKKESGGIYQQTLIQTKQAIKDNHQKLDATVENNMLKEKQNNLKNRFSDESDDDDLLKTKKAKNQMKTSLEDSPIPASPPSPPLPPPPSFTNSKPKRKSTNRINQQLKELEKMTGCIGRGHSQSKANCILLNDSIDQVDEEIFNLINVKVLTKDGIKTFEMNMKDEFSKLYEKIAEKQGATPESIVLMLKERVIKLTETPASIGLKIYDIIDCGKVATNADVQERIKVVNDNKSDENTDEIPSNMTRVIFQTEEGRKSRIKFQISKTEKFEHVLKKYCEKRNMSSLENYIVEFDGERVDLTSTPTDLDLDGDEIFDVRKGKKSTLQKVSENDKVYDYDDDILPI